MQQQKKMIKGRAELNMRGFLFFKPVMKRKWILFLPYQCTTWKFYHNFYFYLLYNMHQTPLNAYFNVFMVQYDIVHDYIVL